MEPSDGSITLIVNPRSGHGGRRTLWEGLWRYLKARGFTIHIRHTRCLGDARQLAAQAAMDQACAMVIVAGGDGTVREAADGLAGSGKPLMLVPTGTENLLASELGIDDRIEGLIAIFQRGLIKTMDLGRVNGRSFASVVGVGFDGQVVHRVGKRRKGHIDYYDYLEPLWHTFWSYRFPPISVRMDGQQVFSGTGMYSMAGVSTW
jgi:diacylglycerol kinase family enzyme